MAAPTTEGRRQALWSYALVAPAIIVMLGVLGVPMVRLVLLSFQQYGIDELISGTAKYIGIANFTAIVQDAEFWAALRRTVLFTAYAVTGSIVLGAVLAHALVRMSTVLRWVVNAILIIVWSMPQLVAISIWRWMFSFDFSIIASVIRSLGFTFPNRDWFVNPVMGFGIIGLVVIWGAIPFITISLYAALTQIPRDYIEAAQIDGANRWHILRHIQFPLLAPVYVILITLSVIWDFQVFSHIWVMLEFRPSPDYYTLAVYAFQTSFGISQYGRGSAIAIAMVLVLLGATGYYIRRMIKETR